MLATIASRAADPPTAIPATAPALSPLDPGCPWIGGLEVVLEEPDPADELLVDAGSQSANPLAQAQRGVIKTFVTAVREMRDFEKGRNLRREVVYVCPARAFNNLSRRECTYLLLTRRTASRIVSPPRTARKVELQQYIGLKMPSSSYRILLNLA